MVPMQQKVFIAILFIFSIASLGAQPDVNSSNLNHGELYKVEYSTSGIYQLTFSDLTQHLNIPNSSIQGDNVRILSQGGGTVPGPNSAPRTLDPIELPTLGIGLDDNSFDSGDKLVFYAPGPHDVFVSGDQLVEQVANPYDFNNYLFVQVGPGIKRTPIAVQNTQGVPERVFTEVLQFRHHERELVNLQDLNVANHGTGKQWFGESFSLNNQQDFVSSFAPLPKLSTQEPVHLSFNFAARSANSTRLRVRINENVKTYDINGTNLDKSESRVAFLASDRDFFIIDKLEQLSFDFLPSSGNDLAWLDYITLNFYTPSIAPSQRREFFVPKSTSGLNKISLENPENNTTARLLNISQFPNYYEIPLSNSANRLEFLDFGNQISPRYISFNPSNDFPRPKFVQKIANQSLKSIPTPECLVVYPDFLEGAVDRWVDHRVNHSNMHVEKANIQQIYNEFSGGKEDPTAIRDFAKYLYEKSEKFEYLLLFGAASFDYRHINKNNPDYNFVPTYETDESMSPIFGYPTDDYFALLKPSQGGDLVGALSINVGRLPARTLSEAHTLVDKIIRYDTNAETRGDWQTRFVFLADDGDNNRHMIDADYIAERTRKDSSINLEKIYFDTYNRESGAGGVRFTEATEKLNEAIQKGCLVVNYLGHGGPFGWASERVLTNDQVQSWTNQDKLPLFITATCTFATFDDPSLESTGEILVSKGDGGAIALFTTSRPVYATSNRRLTASTFDQLFMSDSTSYWPIGKILTEAKNANRDDTLRDNARKYTLLGDPTLQLAIPRYQVVTTSFNDFNAQLYADTIRPLEKVKVQGYIAGPDGLPAENYNGVIEPTLYDKVQERETLGQSSDSYVKTYFVQENILWKGKVKVEGGQFEFNMTVPKSIDESIEKGKISYFAKTTSTEDNARGAFTNFYIGGIPNDTLYTNSPPSVQLYLENDMFNVGDRVGPNPMMYVELFDSLGINLSNNTLGQEIVGILDGKTAAPIVLNSFYEPRFDDQHSGTIFYPLKNLSPGYHSLKVRAWNILGLKAEAEIHFYVVDQDENDIFEISAYPNPFVEEVCFRIKSKLPVGDYEGKLQVFNSIGQIVDEVPVDFLLKGSEISCLKWRPGSQGNHSVLSGYYYCRLKMKKNDSGEVLHSPVLKLIRI